MRPKSLRCLKLHLRLLGYSVLMFNVLVILYVSTYMSQLRVIIALPVHDAIAVKQCDAEWAKEAMERVWSEETLGGKTRLKVDYPD